MLSLSPVGIEIKGRCQRYMPLVAAGSLTSSQFGPSWTDTCLSHLLWQAVLPYCNRRHEASSDGRDLDRPRAHLHGAIR